MWEHDAVEYNELALDLHAATCKHITLPYTSYGDNLGEEKRVRVKEKGG